MTWIQIPQFSVKMIEMIAGEKYQASTFKLKISFSRLGPFKYEPLNAEPHVGRLIDFASKSELSGIRERARGHMKSTPLRTNNNVHDYTRHRTRWNFEQKNNV